MNRRYQIIKTILRKAVARFTYFDNQWAQRFAYNPRFEFKIDDGITIAAYQDSYIAKLLYQGDFERKEIAFMKQHLKPEDTFIDIGANIGYHSLVAAYRVNRVYAYEPTPATYSRMVENILLNKFENVMTFEQAISDLPGRMAFYEHGYDAFNSFVRPDSESKAIDVEVTTIDKLMSSGVIQGDVSLIKIDVEGWEYKVMKGGMEYLAQDNAPTLMVEFNDANARLAGFTCQQVYELGNELGYSWMEITDSGLKPSGKKRWYKYQNLIAIKEYEKKSI